MILWSCFFPGTEEGFATTVFTGIVQCADRTRETFHIDAGWTWFITEGSEEEDGDWLLFGYVIGLAEEWGISCCPKLRASKAHSG